MKKLIKKATSVFVAAVMAASMVMNSSATSWNVFYSTVSGMPSSSQKGTNVTTFTVAYPKVVSKVKESCTSFSNATNSNGSVTYVRYWGYIEHIETGAILPADFSSMYHYSTQSEHTISLGTTFNYKYQLIVTHKLENNTESRASSMSGSVNIV